MKYKFILFSPWLLKSPVTLGYEVGTWVEDSSLRPCMVFWSSEPPPPHVRPAARRRDGRGTTR